MLLYSYVKIFQWENLPTCEIFNNIICIICHIVFRRDIGEYIEGIHANRLSSCDIRLGIIADKPVYRKTAYPASWSYNRKRLRFRQNIVQYQERASHIP